MHSTGIKPASDSVGKAEGEIREDLVRGKGKGLIILLHGVPGVGKTSTAECVAEYTNRPLLSITCGDIGDNAADVQKHLEYYLNLAHRWGCVMLLDEADVFLTARSRDDMHRNAVVSVFLRILEYYSGILFLTTNKIGVVDEAFKSRIHLSLYYPPLSERQTTEIWRINLQRIKQNKPHVEFDETKILQWASEQWQSCRRGRRQQWNGRQIRNACQTIAALAEFDSDGKISLGHLKAVRDASSEFDNYLRSIYGHDDGVRATKNRDRADNYVGRSINVGHYASDEDDGRSGYGRHEPSRRGYGRQAEYDEYEDASGGWGQQRSPTKPRRDHWSPPRDPEYDPDRRADGRRPSIRPPRDYDAEEYRRDRPPAPVDGDRKEGRAGQRSRPESQYWSDDRNSDRAPRR